jgi:hypothetical protein
MNTNDSVITLQVNSLSSDMSCFKIEIKNEIASLKSLLLDTLQHQTKNIAANEITGTSPLTDSFKSHDDSISFAQVVTNPPPATVAEKQQLIHIS